VLDEILVLFNSGAWALWGPFLLLVLCGVGLPMPEDILLFAGGFLGAQYGVHFLTTCTLMYFGILIGDSMIFGIGRHLGPRLLKTRMGRWLMDEARHQKAIVLFNKYGAWVIVVARFLPGLRAPTYLTAGTLNFSIWRFLLLDGLASILSAPIFVWLGHWAWGRYAENIDTIRPLLMKTKVYVGGGMATILAILALVLWLRSKRQPAAKIEEAP
jgi:membrane protein DedA with SNARE-associated domain